MAIETILTCPLGADCETIRDGKVYRCRAYITLGGVHPSTGEPVDETKCSLFEWQPILMLEMSATNRGQTEAITSMRDETITRQDIALRLAQVRLAQTATQHAAEY